MPDAVFRVRGPAVILLRVSRGVSDGLCHFLTACARVSATLDHNVQMALQP